MSKSSVYFTSIVIAALVTLFSLWHFIRLGSLKVVQFLIHPAIELVNYCQTVLAQIIDNPTVTASFITIIFITSGALLVVVLITISIRKYGKLTGLLRPSVPSEKLTKVMKDLDITTEVVCLSTQNVYSFCAGLIQPKIYVSKGLVDTFSEKELKAVLAHESHHAKSYDPLKSLIISCVTKVPLLSKFTKQISQRFILLQELDADAYAIQHSDKTTFLHALTKASFVHEIPAPAFSNAQTLRFEYHLSRKPSYKMGKSLFISTAMITLLLATNLLILNFTSENTGDSVIHVLSHTETACQSETPASFISTTASTHT